MPPLLGGIKVIHWSRVPRIVHQVSVVHSYNDNYLHVYICTHVSTVSQQLISRCIYCTQLIKALAVLATLVNSSCQLSFAAKLALLIHFHISLLCCKLQAFFFFFGFVLPNCSWQLYYIKLPNFLSFVRYLFSYCVFTIISENAILAVGALCQIKIQ